MERVTQACTEEVELHCTCRAATSLVEPCIVVGREEPCKQRVVPARCRLAEVVDRGARGSRLQDEGRDSRSRCRPEGHRMETGRTMAWTTSGRGRSMGRAWGAM
jgi:hypothetical protein